MIRPTSLALALASTGALVAGPAFAQAPETKFPSSSVSAQIFTSYGVPTPSGPQAFYLTRAFLTGKYRFSPMWSGTLTVTPFPQTYVTGVNGGTASTGTEAHDVVLQHAYIQADGIYPGGSLLFGMFNNPWTEYEFAHWGYRMLGPTPIAGGLGTGANQNPQLIAAFDKGLRINGDHGLVNYGLAVINGEGFRANEISGQKTYVSRVTLVPVKGVDVTMLGQIGNPSGAKQADRLGVLLGYKVPGFRTAVEGIRLFDTTSQGVASIGQILSAYGAIGLPVPGLPVEFFVRADQVDGNVDKTQDDRLESVVGLSVTPVKGVTFALNNQNINKNTSKGTVNTNVIGLHASLTF